VNRFLPLVLLTFALTLITSHRFATAQPPIPATQPDVPKFQPPPDVPQLEPPPRLAPQRAVPELEPPVEPKKRTPQETKAFIESIFSEKIVHVFKNACYSCHSDRKAAAGLNLQRLKPDLVTPASIEIWQRVYERVRDKEMPPPDAAPPARLPAEPVVPDPLVPPVRPFFPGRVVEVDPTEENRQAIEGPVELLLEAAKVKYPVALAVPPLLVIRGDESPAQRLHKQLRNNALRRLEDEIHRYESATISIEPVQASLIELINADLTLSTNKEQRIALLTNAVRAQRMLERSTYARYESGREDRAAFLTAKSARLQAQIRLESELNKK
jgi:hypothetical protein